MKFIYLGYFDEKRWNGAPERELNAYLDACFAYDDTLSQQGHPAVGEALKPSSDAVTLRWKDGKVVVTDGPYAETKEQLGGYGIIEAATLDEAVRIIAGHPALKEGACEVRPTVDLEPMIRESERRRAVGASHAQSGAGPSGGMKYVCLGYIDQRNWEAVPAAEQQALMDECFGYDDVLRQGGHFAGGVALGSAQEAKTLRRVGDKLIVTDGPFAETKEQIGGILLLAARDFNHAIQLMSKHPGVKAGPFEIRPADDLQAMMRASEHRRAAVPRQPQPASR